MSPARTRVRRPSRSSPSPKSAAAPPSAPPTSAPPTPAADPLRFPLEGLIYTLDRAPRRHGRRSVLSVALEGAAAGAAPLVDRVDLYAFRSRRAFAGVVAERTGRDPEAVLGHLAWILDQTERAALGERAPAGVLLTPARRQAAQRLLAQPDLLDRAAAALSELGHVGEEPQKRLAYLVATSRLLDRPLSLLVLAPSGTGKSALLDAVASLVPPEEVVTLARLTPQALYYVGEDALSHRLLVVDEYEGQADADHAVRVLQSKGELTQTATVKGRAESFTVRGPVAVMSGTTQTALDPQNTSRCLVLSLDDGPEQTRRVHAAQARAWTRARPPGPALEAWRDAQRLLGEERPLRVVVLFAPRIAFPARSSADRRTSQKVLALVAAHAALHARQRERDREGCVLAERQDYAAVWALLAPALAHDRDGLPPRAARAHQALAQAAGPLTRRELAQQLGWTYMTAARALDDLVTQELAKPSGREPPRRYQLVAPGALCLGAELTPPDALG